MQRHQDAVVFTFIGAVLTSVLELNFFHAVVVLSASVFAALLGNILRITSLFFVEASIVHIDPSLDQFVHQAVGAVAFGISAGLSVLVAMRFSKKVHLGKPGDGR